MKRLIITILALVTALALTSCGHNVGGSIAGNMLADTTAASAEVYGWEKPPYVKYDPLVPNEYSRPGTAIKGITAVVVHYVANPGTTAAENYSYFEGLAKSGETYASAHFIIGLDGEVIQCMPLTELAYCSNSRNIDTVSVECCHPGEDGKFTDATYQSLVKLCAELCRQFGLDAETEIIRHYDVTGKLCPKYFVEHENEWVQFKSDVAVAMK